MGMTTPPGWYPDPDHPGDGPAPERRWDGTAWTGLPRAPGEAAATGPAPAAFPPAGRPTPPGGAPLVSAKPVRPSGRGPLMALLLSGALLLTALLVAGALVFGADGHPGGGPLDAGPPPGHPHEGNRPPPGGDGGRGPQGEGRDEGGGGEEDGDPGPGDGSGEDGLTLAEAGGVALPVPEGWREGVLEGGVAVTTVSGYPCPGRPADSCVDGGAFLFLAPGAAGTSPRDAARADIAGNERAAYSDEAYGGILDSREVLDERITVAGQEGHHVRTRIETAEGTAAFVESAAFPAPDGSGAMVLLRLGVDIGDEGGEDGGDQGGEDGGEEGAAAQLDRILSGARALSAGPGTEA
ncbi:DUF2510 domain-containing protein [Streptomyces hoynatensis]|uniref:DUF2510 domain-containing protein n=1 Tax=Streptomyces hoynatensis TaxID=1141874 RepID=A0A3A9YQ73_9ACTN|nr:DUF2510 domain-containing protein [Streptomyces hoynatensis]RKN38168.1 DUF2510 domain-containing protein [Streptomyces hoynatensis]